MGPFEGLALCVTCNPGYFANDTGLTICSICPAGSFSLNPGSEKCDLCPAGEENPEEGITNTLYLSQWVKGAGSCSRCERGEIAPLPGTEECLPCNVGEESNPTRTSCIPCPIGSFNNETGSSCKACPSGYSTIGINSTECVLACGNGILESLETCDDVNFLFSIIYISGKSRIRRWLWWKLSNRRWLGM